MKITIEKLENGYIIEGNEMSTRLENGCLIESNKLRYIIEEAEPTDYQAERYCTATDDCEKVALARMLEYVGEVFGEVYDKFGSENLSVRFDRKGHKA